MTKVTTDDLLAAIDALGKESPKHPSGTHWLTIAEMAANHEPPLSHGAMDRRLRLALAKGLKAERFVGSDYDATGVLRKKTWYRVRR